MPRGAVPMDSPTQRVDELLRSAAAGDRDAERASFELIYDELRRRARALMNRQAKHHTLQTTALVHEAYLRMCGADSARIEGKRHFLLLATRAMRSILIDHARRRGAEKRGGARERVTVELAEVAGEVAELDIVALNDALERLEQLDAQMAKVAELRCFGGLSSEEIAGILDVSSRTVERSWRFARAWLQRELDG